MLSNCPWTSFPNTIPISLRLQINHKYVLSHRAKGQPSRIAPSWMQSILNCAHMKTPPVQNLSYESPLRHLCLLCFLIDHQLCTFPLCQIHLFHHPLNSFTLLSHVAGTCHLRQTPKP
uniref:Uncharacterized protein n=1 Tax=Triticum urartu TaxID=4572 RepID=A0A8R7P0Z4_TRIUA